MVRPSSIRTFEQCYLGAWLLGFVNLALTWNVRIAALRANPAAAQFGDGFVMSSIIGGVVIGGAITLLLWYFVARRGSDVARWVLVAFFVLGLLFVLFSLARGTFGSGPAALVTLASYVLQAVAVAMLFRPDARAWFARS